MSFILDALRKSEQERQRHLSPGMADLRARNRVAGRPYWLPLVIVLVGINIGLLLFLWLNSGSGPQTTAPVAVAPVADPAATNAAPVTAPITAAVPVLPTETTIPAATSAPPVSIEPTQMEPVTVAAADRSLSSELVPRPLPAQDPVSAPAESLSAPPAPTSSYGNLPTLTELAMAGTISLNPLNIDMHVYSPQAAERFVFINMNKYREGDSLREGPVLTTITEDGVILDYQGRSFLVTRE
jgi:general secretion pathway protein B